MVWYLGPQREGRAPSHPIPDDRSHSQIERQPLARSRVSLHAEQAFRQRRQSERVRKKISCSQRPGIFQIASASTSTASFEGTGPPRPRRNARGIGGASAWPPSADACSSCAPRHQSPIVRRAVNSSRSSACVRDRPAQSEAGAPVPEWLAALKALRGQPCAAHAAAGARPG
jgi:hypothetical protein